MTTQNMQNGSNDALLQLVTFKIGNEEFGVDILHVQEINKMLSITKLPNAPESVEGIINLRGRVIPIIDLRKRLGLVERENSKETSIVVMEVLGKTLGFLVDAVKEVLRIPRTVTEPPPSIMSGTDAGFVTSVAKLDDRLLFLLDIEKLCAA